MSKKRVWRGESRSQEQALKDIAADVNRILYPYMVSKRKKRNAKKVVVLTSHIIRRVSLDTKPIPYQPRESMIMDSTGHFWIWE